MSDLNSIFKGDFFKKDTVVVVSIGASSVKVAVLKKKGLKFDLASAEVREINPFSKGDAREQEVTEALKSLLKDVSLNHSRFFAAVNCPQTAVRHLEVPRMPRAELKDAIKLHAAQYFPFPIEDAQLDFQILNQTGGEDPGKLSVLAATSPKKTVEDTLKLLAKAGIRPLALVPAPLAMREASLEYTGPGREALAILDVGFELTELVILSGKELVFSRSIPVAGKDFTQAMTVSLASEKGRVQLSWEEAERIKRIVGVPSEAEPRMIEDKISTGQILSMLRSPMELLISEIERCFDYYREESAGGKIGSMLLYGGGAELKGFSQTLSLQLGIEVRVGVSHRLEVATGTALLGSTAANNINLLPQEIKEETKRTFKRASVQSAAAALILLFAFVYIGMKIKNSNMAQRIIAAKQELASLGPQLEEMKARQLAAGIIQEEPYWEDVFKELSHVVPKNIYLTRIRLQGRTLFLSGVVVSGERQAQISDFILSLEKGLFDHVRLVTTKELGAEAANEFELRGWVD